MLLVFTLCCSDFPRSACLTASKIIPSKDSYFILLAMLKDRVKDRDIYIDQSLTYNEHIAKTVSICLHKLVQINRIKHLLDEKTILLLMNSFVFSKLYYCSTVWSNTSKHNINKLQLVQNFAARVVLGLKKFDHISQAIKSLNWLPVNDRIYLNDPVMTYKCINKLVPDYLIEQFTLRSQTHTRNTRQRDQLNIPRCRQTTGQRSNTYRGGNYVV